MCTSAIIFFIFLSLCTADPRDLPFLTPSFPTRRSSDLGRVDAPLRQRRTEAESSRATLTLMRRFHYIFSLPARVREHIHLGDAEQVIRTYKRDRKSTRLNSSH